jgi:hypothetical protein
MGGYDRTISRSTAKPFGLEWDAEAINTMEVSIFDVMPMMRAFSDLDDPHEFAVLVGDLCLYSRRRAQ